MFINYQFVNLSQKYALEQYLSECLSHKSYNKKEVRMLQHPSYTSMDHPLDRARFPNVENFDLRIKFFIRELVLNVLNVLMASDMDLMCPQGRYEKIKLLDFSVNALLSLSVIDIRNSSLTSLNPCPCCIPNILNSSVPMKARKNFHRYPQRIQ